MATDEISRSWMREALLAWGLGLPLMLAPGVSAVDPGSEAAAPPAGLVLFSSAHHSHGSCGPLLPNSSNVQGFRRDGEARILTSTAHHPFSVGHYRGEAGAVWVGINRSHRFIPRRPVSGLHLDIPLELGACRATGMSFPQPVRVE